jgi:uncharacterized membrane protein
MSTISAVEKAEQKLYSFGQIALMALITHLIFSCAVYEVWAATGDMIGSDWGSCLMKVSIVLLLLIPFAISKTRTLNGLFDRV